MLMWLSNLNMGGGGGASTDLIAQERSLFRFVFARVFSRVN